MLPLAICSSFAVGAVLQCSKGRETVHDPKNKNNKSARAAKSSKSARASKSAKGRSGKSSKASKSSKSSKSRSRKSSKSSKASKKDPKAVLASTKSLKKDSKDKSKKGAKKEESSRRSSKSSRSSKAQKEQKERKSTVFSEEKQKSDSTTVVRPSSNMKVEPQELNYETRGGLKDVVVVNNSTQRKAFKVKCSDNMLYRVNQVHGIVEPGSEFKLEVLRNNAAAKTDKLVVLTTDAGPDDTDAREVFTSKDTQAREMMIVPLLAH
ncbi:unnamed protein product [Caenorhabditis auriculariae]|uniref:Major sperm protein n=1 Tax=Caenorhabditis auriculariae TaxID=2777116 RepID=A0A8S1HWU6_9PELO|nr:unnamed protein product [Caenorhabditis auriculariae]